MKYIVTCLSQNVISFIDAEEEPTACPTDNCGHFDCTIEQ